MRYDYDSGSYNISIHKINIIPISREKGYRHSFAEGRPCHAFIYTERGRMLDEFVQPIRKNIITEPGTLIFVPKGTKYSGTYLDENTKIKTIQFDIDSGSLPDYLSSPKIIELGNAKATVNAFFNSIENPKSNHFFHYVSLLYDLLWQIDTQYVKLPKKFVRLNAAVDDITLYPEKNEKISYYSNMCGMCEVNFRRLFVEYTGKSPIEYRNDLRLKKAKELLQSGEYNVSESAEAVGFSNLSFFTRLYKKKFGTSPKKEV